MTGDQRVVVDPRMPAAPRTRLAEGLDPIAGKTVLLLDNGKIRSEFGNYGAAFDVFEKGFVELGATVERMTVDLLGDGGFDEPAIRALAKELRQRSDGVLIGLADAGVSAPSVMLAAALEESGVPTAVLCQGVGASVVAAMASHLVPGLPQPELSVWRLSSTEDVAADTQRMWPEVLAGFTGPRSSPVGSELDTRGELEVPIENSDREFTALMGTDGYGDGFPLIAPTQESVSRMVEAMGADPDEVIWGPVGARQSPTLTQDIAAVSVMAGCGVEVAKIVLEAFRCMGEPEFRLFQAAITAHPSGTLVLVSGAAATQAGMNEGYGCLGPGSRANATIGRAIALSYSFLLGMRPGIGDIGLQGSSAEYSFCTAENLKGSPWRGLHADLAGEDASTVTVLRAEGGHNVLDHTSSTAENLLEGLADTASSLGGNNLYSPGAQTIFILNPEHARIIDASGWTKRDAQMFLFERARRRRTDLVGRGITTTWRPWVGEQVPIVEDPSDILIVVSGAPGPQSQVVIPWGYSRGITRVLPPS